ncbi:O-antigen ligase family protein [Paenibacillus sp. FSL E2-0178]|uniref:O-antigen ligase family protein n=1 Tax=Paenibacillus sp. FSL E2-0178 TaxID=2921361 RepID=UPI003157FC25
MNKEPVYLGLTKLQIIIWMAVILYFFNIFNVGHYLIFALLPLICWLIFRNTNKVNYFQLLLFLFCSIYTYLLFNYHQRPTGVLIVTLLFPSVFYFFGDYLAKNDTSFKKTYFLLLSITTTLVTFAFLSLITSDISNLAAWRGVSSIWGENISATGLNTYLSLGLSLLPICLFSTNKKVRLIALLNFILSVYCMLKLGSRTGIIIIAVPTAVSFLLLGKMNIRKVLGIIFFVFLCFITWNYIDSTYLFSRLSSMDNFNDPRFAVWKDAVIGIFKYPLGGNKVSLPLKYAHNMWLDVGIESGILPFVLLIILTVSPFITLFYLLRNNFPNTLKMSFICILSSFFICFFLEPIMEGWLYYFNGFCFFLGIMNRIVKEHRSNTINEIYSYNVKSHLLIISLVLLLFSLSMVIYLTTTFNI